MSDAQALMDAAIDRFTPDIAARGRLLIAQYAAKHPTANCLVYDNYNALAVAFASGETASSAFLSVTFYPRWVSIFFARGIELDDPEARLEGAGARIRHVKIPTDDAAADPYLDMLTTQAATIVDPPISQAGTGKLLIKTAMDNRRSRRP